MLVLAMNRVTKNWRYLKRNKILQFYYNGAKTLETW
jgi:hypothetical protein